MEEFAGGPASPPPAGDGGPVRADPPVAEAERITKRYGETTALDHAHITIRPGETHALVGRNGAGKSTLVSILTGLQAPDEGEVRFAGSPAPRLSDRDAWRERVACVYQKSTIIPELTVAENLYLNRHDRNRLGLVGWKGLWRKAADLLEAWSVDVDVRRPAAELGVEQRQFVEIARALSFGARFIILDEPTAQLDASAIPSASSRLRVSWPATSSSRLSEKCRKKVLLVTPARSAICATVVASYPCSVNRSTAATTSR